MTTDASKISVHITLEWNSEGSVDGFARYQRVVDALRATPGVEITAALSDQATAPATASTSEPGRRGRPRKPGNGAEHPSPNPNPSASALTPAAPPTPAQAPQDVHGDGVPEEGDSETEDLGLGDDHTLTPEEALERSLGGIRNAFNAGHKAQIYDLRKKYGVTKFDEIEAARGHALYKDVQALLEKVGMHI